MSLLYDTKPLIVNPELATLLGLNEALILQQIHYWIQKNQGEGRNYNDGRYWTYNSISKWKENNFPFFSESTIKRTLKYLRDMKILITGNYNKRAGDQTKWYSINYDELDKLEIKSKPLGQNEPMVKNDVNKPEGQYDQLVNMNQAEGQNDPDQKTNLTQPLPEISSEISPEILILGKDKRFIKAFNDFCIKDDEDYRSDTAFWIFRNAAKYKSSSEDIMRSLEICCEKEKEGDLAYYTGILRKKTKNRKAGIEPFGKPEYFRVNDYVKKRVAHQMEFIKQFEVNIENKSLYYSVYYPEDREAVHDIMKLVVIDTEKHTGINLIPKFRI